MEEQPALIGVGTIIENTQLAANQGDLRDAMDIVQKSERRVQHLDYAQNL